MSEGIIIALIGGGTTIAAAIIGYVATKKEAKSKGQNDDAHKGISSSNSTTQGHAINISGNDNSIILDRSAAKDPDLAWLRDRGLFSLRRKASYYMPTWAQEDFFDFDNPAHRFLLFEPKENSVIHRYEIVKLNGSVVKQRKGEDANLPYLLNSNEPYAYVALPLEESHLQARHFECEITFGLQTLSGHNYSEVVEMSFQWIDEYWKLEKYKPQLKS